MRFLRRPKSGEPIATAVLDFYAGADGEFKACKPNWAGDEQFFLMLPGTAIDEYLPYVRVADGKLLDEATQAVLDEVQTFVNGAHAAVEQSKPPPLWDALPLVNDYPNDIAAKATISIRLSHEQERLWADTVITPKKARDILFFTAPRVCWDWVFTEIADDLATARAVVADLLLLCDDYRENGVPRDFFLKGIGRAPYRLWVKDGATVDLRRSAEP
jgi:hypothetical protein